MKTTLIPMMHWGISLWIFIHTICIVDSIDDLESIRTCLLNIVNVIPCKDCKSDYENELHFIRELDLSNDINALFIWSINFHNKINKKLDKEQVSLEEALTIWTTSTT